MIQDKDTILEGLQNYLKARKFMEDNDLVMGTSDYIQVADSSMVQLADLFNIPIGIKAVKFRGEKVTEAFVYVNGTKFISWDFSIEEAKRQNKEWRQS